MTTRLQMVLDLLVENPDEPMPRYMAGNELLSAGEFRGAVAHLERYLEMLPGGDVGAACRLLGRAHRGLGDEAAARAAFERGIASALAHGHGDLAEAIRQEIEG